MIRLLCLALIAIFGIEVEGNPVIGTDRFFGFQNFNRHQSFGPSSFQSDEVDFVFVPVNRFPFEQLQFDGNQDVIFIPSFENFDFSRQNSGRNFAVSNFKNEQNVVANDRQQFKGNFIGQSHNPSRNFVSSNSLNKQKFAPDNNRQQINRNNVVQRPNNLVESNFKRQETLVNDRSFNKDFVMQDQNQRNFVESNLNKQNVVQDPQQLKRDFNVRNSIMIQEMVPITEPNVVQNNQPLVEESRSNLLLRSIINGIQKDIFNNKENKKEEVKREILSKQEFNKDITRVQEMNIVPSQSQNIEVRSRFQNPSQSISRSRNLLNGIIGGIRKDLFPNNNVNKGRNLRIDPTPINKNFVHQHNDVQQASSNTNRLTKQRLLVPMHENGNGQGSRSQLLLGSIIGGIQKDIFKDNNNNNRRITFN